MIREAMTPPRRLGVTFEAAPALLTIFQATCFRDRTFDQAGIMVRLNEETWVKAGIEFNDGNPMISSVLTRCLSDWAPSGFSGDPGDFWLRITISGGVLRLQYSTDGTTWPLLRLAPFPHAESYQVGPICCTPQRQGLKVRFSEWSLTPPLGRDLHDLS
ncbi:DUF1349 domain-containing protein [Pseudomonas marginalis]|uniref:DUF1349 domain-containing protein n=2 Tax=Pseudomonas marginalis TaxID=298 RepID=UPI0009ED7EAF|nr:DUF1349 domain-containing protein [Pseudomonas marginalis]